MEDILILVDENDNEIGSMAKLEAHKKEKLHRAFSVFLFNLHDNTMLIHQRAIGKYHSGGLWTNSCCSHPRKGETLSKAVIRRMKQELGIDLKVDGGFKNLDKSEIEDIDYESQGINAKVTYLGKFQYYKKFENCAEHEIDNIFYMEIDESEVLLNVDKDEIKDYKWINIDDLKLWLKDRPEDFTAWFEKALSFVLKK